MTDRGGGDRRIGDVLVALTLVLVLVFIAVAVSATGGTFATTTADDTGSGSGDDSMVDRSVLVGGGSHGDADFNPIGAPSGNEDNPFQSRSDEIQFYVETDYPGYWRVDAYDEYNDGVWNRTGEYSEYRGQLSAEGPTTAEITHNVTVERDTATLPTVWQPAAITTADEQDLRVSPETGLQAAEPMEAGRSYTVESYCYAPDAEQLRDADGTTPVAIDDRYTGVSESVPDRVHELSADITEDADSSIEAANAIVLWLETNTAYSLEAEYDDGEPIDQFLFADQTGSSEHIAASTTLLLQSQDIPARYVTGYAPGESLSHSDDTYAVRGIHAHAWTEIYISGHGWIPLDPTPADDRIGVENSFVDSDGEMLDVPITGECPVSDDEDEEGDDGDAPDDGDAEQDPDGEDENDGDSDPNGGETNGAEQDDADSPETDTPPGIDIELSEPVPAPGDQLTVTVTRDGEVVEGATVSFNDEQIGTTNATGQIVGTVPYSETLVIDVRIDSTGSAGSVGAIAGASPNAHSSFGDETTVFRPNSEAQFEVEEENVSVPINADLTVETDPNPLIAGGDATVRAFLNDDPLPETGVYLEGEHVATTDQDGNADVTIPDDPTDDTVTFTVRRDELETEHTASVGTLEVTADSDRVLAFPGQELSVTVSVAGEPLEAATVYREDEQVGTTDENGTTTVGMAAGLTTSVMASFRGQEATTTIENLLLPVTLFGVVIVGFAGGATVFLNRRHDAAERAGSRTVEVGRRLFERVATVLLWAETLPKRIRDSSTGSWRAYGSAIVKAPSAVVRWLSNVQPKRIVGGIRALATGIVRTLMVAIGVMKGKTPGSPTADTTGPDGQQPDSTGTHRSVRKVWRAFVRLVGRRTDSTMTPGAIADRAIENGFPRRPVKRLTDAFRAAEYGPETATPRVEEASDALGEIETESAAQQRSSVDDSGSTPAEDEQPDERPTGD